MEIPKWISPETVALAKSVNLYDFIMQCEPEQARPKGANSITLAEHGSMTIEIGTGVWIRNQGKAKGKSAVDYMVHVRGMSFKEAVMHVLNAYFHGKTPDMPAPPPIARASPRLDKPFALPEAHTTNKHVIAYLIGRGIDREIIETCIAEKRIYESVFIDKSRRVHHNCVFVGFDRDGVPRCATLRGTYEKYQYRRDVGGSSKRFYFSLPAGDSRSLFVTEGAIDALAKATLIKQKGGDWRGLHILPLGGVGESPDKLPQALEQYLRDYPRITNISLGLDNDDAGAIAARDIRALLDGRYTLRDDPPPIGKDYGDTAKALMEPSRARNSAALSL